MQSNLNHGTDEVLESYAFGRLPADESTRLEEHLLVCQSCLTRLDEAGHFMKGMRAALLEQPVREAKPAVDWFAWLRRPSFALGAACAAILLISLVFSQMGRHVNELASVNVSLTATRGAMPEVPLAQAFNVTLTDAPKGEGPFRLEFVNAEGKTVWSGLAPDGNPVHVKIEQRRMPPGDYFLRLYGAEGSLLHEYGMKVQ